MSTALDDALGKLDQALAARPRSDPYALTEATELLCRHREARIAAGAGRQDLEALNAVISVVLAAHYPIGGIPWTELETARHWLMDLRTTV